MNGEQPVASPCSGICALNSEKLCMGCFRTSHEIRLWRGLNDDQRRKVLALCGERQRRDMPQS